MSRSLNENSSERQALSLYELNNLVKEVIHSTLSPSYWVRAEMSDVRVNASSGHCYLEFIEKNEKTGVTIARARAAIWAKTFCMLKPYFESVTGQRFASGLKVMVRVSVEFHELYGFSLMVSDIDPAYTLGDMAKRRLEIVRQLKEEGVFDLNRELPFPVLPQRVAVITSPTAAGFGDFVDQLDHNEGGFVFYWKLFPALMQGEKTEESVIAALDRIYRHLDLFDVVVIIRGGGATSELNSFDSYLLAANCAQFPLPVISGIGHERDDTIVDMVAHKRMKTPTAVAGFLIDRMAEAYGSLMDLQQRMVTESTGRLQEEKSRLQLLGSRLPGRVMNRIERNRSLLQRLELQLPVASDKFIQLHKMLLGNMQQQLKEKAVKHIDKGERFVQLTEQFVRMASPDYVLKRGYSLTLRDGKIVKSAAKFKAGDVLVTRFADGEVRSEVLDE